MSQTREDEKFAMLQEENDVLRAGNGSLWAGLKAVAIVICLPVLVVGFGFVRPVWVSTDYVDVSNPTEEELRNDPHVKRMEEIIRRTKELSR